MENFEKTNLINPKDLNALQDHFKGKNIQFVDASFVLPNSDVDVIEYFKTKRIKGAVFFDIRHIAAADSGLPNMLPEWNDFQTHIQALGIDNNDILICYGQGNMLMGPARAWWMFKGFGHKHVYVLNGSLDALSNALEIDSTAPEIVKISNYRASPFNLGMVVNMTELLETSNEQSCAILDARGAARFSGEGAEPRQGMRSGHIPNSINIPYASLLDENGRMKSNEQLQDILGAHKGDQKIITTCGSGVTACALALALNEIGHKDVAVYDGSWSEWGLESSGTPIKTN